MDGMLLLRLRDLAVSSRLGLPDRGFPASMAQLEALGYARPAKDGGYAITEQGTQCLAANRETLRVL